jgi:aerobic-type carbon monoxide dehydrogenase small subunit (CoxS/CutS family)
MRHRAVRRVHRTRRRRAIKSCNILAVQAQGANVRYDRRPCRADGTMHPMQAAFKDCHGLQCGFCTPGMVMSAIDLVTNHPNADEKAIREGLEGNLCRCTGITTSSRRWRRAPRRPWAKHRSGKRGRGRRPDGRRRTPP